MNSPFPGMDPYLEHPGRWRSFHTIFIGECAGELNSLLPAEFVAVVEERVYVVPPGRSVYPDVMIIRKPEAAVGRSGSTAVMEPPTADMPEIVTLLSDPIREHYIEIKYVGESGHPVVVIELLSPSNK